MIFGTYRVDASKVRCPVLVLGGEKDRIVSQGLLRATAKRYGASLIHEFSVVDTEYSW